jgi:hypothetical protein
LTNEAIKYRAQDKIRSLSKIRRIYPRSVSENKREFNLAIAKIWYYKFQFCLKENDISSAIKNIGKIKFVDIRYFLIFTSILFSPNLYKIALKYYDKRGL